MLSRARKYQLGLYLAHQSTNQIPQALLAEIFGNVTAFIAFSVSNADANKLSQEYFVDEGISGSHVQPHEFQRLKTGEALAKIDKTIIPFQTRLAPQDYDHRRAEMIIERLRQNYAGVARWEGEYKPPDLKFLPPPDEDDDINARRVF